MKVQTIVLALAAVVAATPVQNVEAAQAAQAAASNDCVDCAKYCSDDSNGNAIGAACYIVKCGISCLIG
ncbi:hypothetical protein K4F52_000625 [Lecanicillium sp. MT-2017a]|nr:hypothetical protein K4F52_000625 [Lecanicillium sp. MT-2017a]